MWRLEINDSCIGSGVCAGTAPRHFALGDDDRGHPLASPTAADEVILDASASCPMEAITVTDAHTGESIDP